LILFVLSTGIDFSQCCGSGSRIQNPVPFLIPGSGMGKK
jgi:hypothetical protein